MRLLGGSSRRNENGRTKVERLRREGWKDLQGTQPTLLSSNVQAAARTSTWRPWPSISAHRQQQVRHQTFHAGIYHLPPTQLRPCLPFSLERTHRTVYQTYGRNDHCYPRSTHPLPVSFLIPLLMKRKVDRSPVRPPVFPGELTPASSGHSSMVSPVSATSGPRSPRPNVRKVSLPGPRRPPSPELTNLDCAFPPFPIPSRATTTRKRERAATHKGETNRSRSRDAAKAIPQGSRPFPLARAGSSNDLAQTADDKQYGAKQARPSSPLSSRNDSLSSKSNSRQESLDEIPEIQPSPLDLPSLVSLSETEHPIHGTSRFPKSSSSSAEPDIDQTLSSLNFGDPERKKFKAPLDNHEAMSRTSGIEDQTKTEIEPTYKSKRPPPLLSEHEISALTKARSPTTPQPSSAGSSSKGWGRFFGRRRSRSATSRREVVRQALSDEPEAYENQVAARSILSPGSDRSFLTAEPSPLPVSPLTSPDPLPSHEDSLKALEGLIPEPVTATTATPTVVIEPFAEHASSLPAPSTLPEIIEPKEVVHVNKAVANPQESELIEALRRASIDSASSYGSFGFSEHNASSRSSSPHTDSRAVKSFGSSFSTLFTPPDVDMPAPLKPRIPELLPDSPTDPLFQQGRLSPIPGPSPRPTELALELLAVPNEPRSNLEPIQGSDAPLSNKTKTTATNKGICRGCSQVILAAQKSVSSADGRLSGRYHKDCFVCQTCQDPFPTAEFYVHHDQPYCAQHYHELEDSLCATCGKGIEGLYMETANVAGRGKEKHHPECLKCTTCKIRLDHDYFELSGKVYCERDAFRQVTLPKSHGNAPSRPSPLIREYISSGDPGLVKGRNFPERRITRLMNMA